MTTTDSSSKYRQSTAASKSKWLYLYERAPYMSSSSLKWLSIPGKDACNIICRKAITGIPWRVRSLRLCAVVTNARGIWKRHLKPLFMCELFKCIAIHILAPLSWTKYGDVIIIVRMNRYARPTIETPAVKTRAEPCRHCVLQWLNRFIRYIRKSADQEQVLRSE